MRAQLDAWADDPAITRVVIQRRRRARVLGRRRYPRALRSRPAGRHDEALQFWRDEYPLNVVIKNYRKPYVALIDGIVMGGGVGVSVHGSHRVAGDRFQFAMPEVGIGFFPDVGATWFLPRMPGELGTYCALTGERFGSADGVRRGVATHRIRLGALCRAARRALTGTVSVDALLAAFAEPAGEGADRWRGARRSTGCSPATASRTSSPRSTARRRRRRRCRMGRQDRRHHPHEIAAQPQTRAGAGAARRKHWDFETCMRTEFRIVSRIIHGHDFYEGVRAVIVDKDNAPRWQPATLAEVSEAEVERHFAPLGADELVLP